MIAYSIINKIVAFGTPDVSSITIGTNINYQTTQEYTFHNMNNVRFPVTIGDHLDICSE
jgi:hypothetical protein